MKTYGFRWTVSLIFIFGSVSCAANLEMQKKQAKASRNLGEAYYRQGNYPSALGELLKSETLYPGDPFLQNDLGLTYMAMEKMDLAVKHFKKALEIKPDYAPAINNLGTAYLNMKEWDTAIRYFKEVRKTFCMLRLILLFPIWDGPTTIRKSMHLPKSFISRLLKLIRNLSMRWPVSARPILPWAEVQRPWPHLKKQLKIIRVWDNYIWIWPGPIPYPVNTKRLLMLMKKPLNWLRAAPLPGKRKQRLKK